MRLPWSLSPSDGRVGGVNSRYAFHLTQPRPSQSWLAALISAERRERISFEIKVGTDGIVNPYTFLSAVSLPHIFQQPGFKCLSVDPVEREGRTGAKVTFSYAATIPEPGYPSESMDDLQGWVILSPDDHWSIQEWKVSFAKAKTEVSRAVEYGETVDGYRIPRRSQGKTIVSSDPGKEIGRIAFDYEKFTRIDLPEGAFSLSAYGLPELLAEASEKKGRRYLVALLFGLAALGILVSVILRRRSKRSLQ